MQQALSLPKVDIGPLDALLLDDQGHGRAPRAVDLLAFPPERIQVWAHLRARYGIPTAELLVCLRTILGARRAIEIGAGMGDLGRLLGIPRTDSYSQTSPELRALYAGMGQPVIEPPSDVERLDALAAIAKHKPEVVVASWVTQLYLPGDEKPPKIGSSVLGVDELTLLREVTTYVFVGNREVHGDKRALRKPHAEYQGDVLVSRAFTPRENVLYVWGPHEAPDSTLLRRVSP